MARVYDRAGAGTTRTVTAPVPCTGMPPGPGMPLARLGDVSQAVRETSSRKAKIALLAACLRGLGPGESLAGVAFLSGAPRQRQTGAGWAALRSLPAAADEPALTVGEVDAALERLATLAGPGSRGARLEEVERLFSRATAPEHEFLVSLILGDLRQGALAGVMTEAVAQAAAVPLADGRRAAMLGRGPAAPGGWAAPGGPRRGRRSPMGSRGCAGSGSRSAARSRRCSRGPRPTSRRR